MKSRPTAAILLALLFCDPLSAAVRFVGAAERSVMAGTEVPVQLEGLPAGKTVELRAERVVHAQLLGGKRVRFRSQATYAVGDDGRLNLATAPPIAGSYRRADPRGLFWSMTATDEAVAATAAVGEVRISAWLDDTELSRQTIRFQSVVDGLIREPVDAFPGAVLFKPPAVRGRDPGRQPVIVLLGGAEGGTLATRDEAPKLASRGYTVLGLPWYSPPSFPLGPRELPELPADLADIPVERLRAVRDWIAQRPDLDAGRIVLYGASKGAEFALLAASHCDWVHAVVAIAPSDVVWEGFGFGVAEADTRSSFALDGKPLPFVPYDDFFGEYAGFMAGEDFRMRRPHDRGRAAHPERVAAARIPIERFQGPVLLLAGQDDQLWNAAAMAHNIAERRAEAGLPTEAGIYPEAGHFLSGNGWAPTTHYDLGLKKAGGTPEGNARAQADAWTRIGSFLDRHARRQ